MKHNPKFAPLEVMTFAGGLVFFAPVALLVRTRAGLSLERFFALQAVLSLVIFLLEIPAGRLTDRVGYRNTLVLSAWTLLLARGLLLVAFLTRSYALFLLEALAEGLSACLSSGTVSAYLYRLDDGDGYVVRMARIENCGTAGFIVSTVAYAGLYRLWGLTGLLVATALAGTVGAAASLGLEGETRPSPQSTPEARPRLGPKPADGLIVATLACSGLAFILINFFYVDKLQGLGIPEEWMTAVILGYSALQLLAERILKAIPEARRLAAYALALVIAGGMLALLGTTNRAALALPVMLLLPLAMTLPEILLEEIQNRMID